MNDKVNSQNATGPVPVKANWQSVIILTCAALISTSALSVLQSLTKDRIETQRQAAIEAALSQVIPGIKFDNQLQKSQHILAAGGFFQTQAPLYFYPVQQSNHTIAIIFDVVAPDGYNGDIRVLLGVHKDGRLLGSRVTHHLETPGLGDAIEHEKSNWMKQFDEQNLVRTPSNQWYVSRQGGDFDSITGATVTSSAIISLIERTLRYAQTNHEQLFEKT